MKRRMKIYTPFISAGMQEVATYRVNWIFYMLGNVVVCLVSYFIWRAVYASGDGGAMNGFTMPQMIVYIVLVFLTNTMIASDVSYVIGEEVRDGAISMRMLKPVSFNATFLFQEIGNKLFTEFILALPLIFVVEVIRTAFSGEIEFDVLRFFLFLFSAATAYLIYFFFNIWSKHHKKLHRRLFVGRGDSAQLFARADGSGIFIASVRLAQLHSRNDLYGQIQRLGDAFLPWAAIVLGSGFLCAFKAVLEADFTPPVRTGGLA